MSVESELTSIVAATRGLFSSAACSCALASEDGASLTFVAADGAGAAEIIGVTLPVSRGIVGYVALSGQPMAVADVARDDRFARDIAEQTNYVPTSIVAAPMIDADGETIGVIEVLDPARGEESYLGGQRGTAAELAVLTVVASQASSVLRLARAVEPRGEDSLLAALDGLDDAGRSALLAFVTSLTGRRR